MEIFKVQPTPCVILLPDHPDFTIAAVNDAFLLLNHITRHQVIGETLTKAFALSNFYDIRLLHHSLQKVLETKKPDHLRAAAINMVVTPVLNDLNEVEYIICSQTEIRPDSKHIYNEPSLLVPEIEFQSLLNAVGVVVWMENLQTFEVTYISEQVKIILGYTPEEWLSDPFFWEKHIHPGDKETAIAFLNANLNNTESFTLHYRMARTDGQYVWIKNIVSVLKEEGKPTVLQGIMVDITETRSICELDYLEKRVLELNGKKGITAQEVLSEFVVGFESVFPAMKCAILQVKDNRLYKLAAPSLPEAYLEAIEGLPVGKSVGSSGAAALLKQEIIITDIKNDRRCARYRKIALKANIKACWAYPILNAKNKVLATFGIYYNEPKAPGKDDLNIIERVTTFLKMIIENRYNLKILQETNRLMVQCEELAQFGNWSWDIATHKVFWSDTLYTLFGIKKGVCKPSFEAYLELLHPDDKERISVLIGGVLSTKKDVQYEERIVWPNGVVRHLKSCAKVILDDTGSVVKLIGANMDITSSKKIQEELFNSESRFRSLVETQTNYVLRVDFKGRFTYCNEKYKEDFGWIYEDQDLLGLEAYKTVPEHHYQWLFNQAEVCINHPNRVYEVEIEHSKKDGGLKAILWHIVCLTDDKGSPFEMQGIGIDITAQKLVKDALSISNERYKYVNMANNDAIYDWDIVEDQIKWGDGYYRLFGYDAIVKRFTLSDWEEKVHVEDLEMLKLSLNEVLLNNSKHIWSSVYRFKKSDGSYAYVEDKGYTIRNVKGEAIRVIGAMRDITARKNAEAEMENLHEQLKDYMKNLDVSNARLMDSRKKYKDLFNLSPQPMWVYEAGTFRFLDVNDAAIKSYGYTREEYLAMDGRKIRPKDEDVDMIVHKFLKAHQEQGIIHHGIMRHLNKNGDVLLMDIQSKKLKINGRDAYLVLANDLTEKLNELDFVTRKNQNLKEIAVSQSNVLQVPLTKMMRLVALIQEQSSSDKEKAELMSFLLNSSIELDDITTIT
jgi:PAS domain S-box-containing protein